MDPPAPASPDGPSAILPLPAAADPAGIFVPVAGEEPLVRALSSLLDRVAAPRVAVVVTEPLMARVHDVLAARGWAAVAVVAAPLPGDRHRAMAAGLQYLASEQFSAAPVLVLDHRHPLVPGEVTDRVLAGLAAGHRIVVPVVPVSDSVKAVATNGAVVGTIDRTTLRAVQYPRGFSTSALAEVLALGSSDDELGAALAAGLSVGTVDGHRAAVPFTLPADAELLAAIIRSRH